MRKVLVVFSLIVLTACTSIMKMSSIKKSGVVPEISLPPSAAPSRIAVDDAPSGDTLKVRDAQGRELLIMRAVRDEKGEMVANETLGAAVVTAKFKNVAERHGRVNLRFILRVPAGMMDPRWQIRLIPLVRTAGDSILLDPVIVTGDVFRRSQLRGYQQYQRFLSSIITDSTRFIRVWDLEQFIKRNIPQLYAFKADTSYVSDEKFLSAYGVSGPDALAHYTKMMLRRFNARKLDDRQKMFCRYVKSPILTSGFRKDTLIGRTRDDLMYEYVQEIPVRAGMRKADVFLSGDISEQGRKLFDIPESGPLTFYISSLSTLVDSRPKYKTRVIERREDAAFVWNIAFRQGCSEVDSAYIDNSVQIGSIRNTLNSLENDGVYELDSVNVVSSCSPEGGFLFNLALSLKRSVSVASFFGGGTVPFSAGSEGENWTALDGMIEEDSFLDSLQKKRYSALRKINNPDLRETVMAGETFYPYMRDSLYPRLRTVRFDFHLHRKGMVKDTVHTTEVDTLYMKGLGLVSERRYLDALACLHGYSDYNTALCYVSLDRNMSALEILQKCEDSPKVKYLLALVYSRIGDDASAIENYLKACNEDPSLVHRGNLDPEISLLVKKYNINQNN